MATLRKANNNARRIRAAAAQRARPLTEYRIRDPRPTRAENPFSFYLPCDARIAAIAPFDRVQAIFEPVDGSMPERMWIEVIHADEAHLVGFLINEPMGMKLPFGTSVCLQRTDVISIDTDREDDPEETNNNDRWFRRCLADVRIQNDGAKIARIVREEPPEATDQYGESGWRFEAEGYTPGMPLDRFALVVPLRRETGYENLLDAPVGSVIERTADGFRLAA